MSVCSDSVTEINTLSHADLFYQGNPHGVPVDMDTVNIAGNPLPAVPKVQLCDLILAAAGLYILHSEHVADFKGSYAEHSKLNFLSHISYDPSQATSKSQKNSILHLLNPQGCCARRR